MSGSTTISALKCPHFIIGGAMKCGTTSLHYILAQHPGIFIPDGEIHYFDMDDPEQHPDFFLYSRGAWTYPDLESGDAKYTEWYSSFFRPARENQLIGEDSTTYLASERSAERIREVLPDVKLIFMLRDPAARTYSHYWHLVRTGRATHSFERMLQVSPGKLLQRSVYKPQLERFLNLFPRENIQIILFEDFTKNLADVVDRVLKFLDVPNALDTNRIRTHWNQAAVPRSLAMQLLRNRLIRRRSLRMYESHLPFEISRSWQVRVADMAGDLLSTTFVLANPFQERTTPPMRSETRTFLNHLLKKANTGLPELLDVDLDACWYRSAKNSGAKS